MKNQPTNTQRLHQFLNDFNILCHAPRGTNPAWFDREASRYPAHAYKAKDGQNRFTPLHPGVLATSETLGLPKSWQTVLLQTPHVPQDMDKTKVAFTLSPHHGAQDRQTRVALTKYLTAHWPWAKPSVIRDLAARFAPLQYAHYNTLPRIVWAVEAGPRSCMQSHYGGIPFDTGQSAEFLQELRHNESPDTDLYEGHPYTVYDPSYGWGVAVLTGPDGRVMARALTLETEHKCFVRSYHRGETCGSYSATSTELEAKLQEHGFIRRRGWPVGTRLSHEYHPHGGILLPYLDGCNQHVALCDGDLTIADEGDMSDSDCTYYKADNTDGTGDEADRNESIGSCNDCGDTLYEGDDYSYVGRDEDSMVCDSCYCRSYTLVRGSRRNYYNRSGGYSEYSIPEDEAASVENCSYSVDPDNLPEDVVALEDGGYAERDDIVEIDGDYYMTDDTRVIQAQEEDDCGSTYALRDDCWQDGDGNWHRDGVPHQEIDGSLWLEDDCWQCAGDGAWYLSATDDPVIDPDTGDEVHPDWLAVINRDCLDEPYTTQHELPLTDCPTAPTPVFTPTLPRHPDADMTHITGDGRKHPSYTAAHQHCAAVHLMTGVFISLNELETLPA